MLNLGWLHLNECKYTRLISLSKSKVTFKFICRILCDMPMATNESSSDIVCFGQANIWPTCAFGMLC